MRTPLQPITIAMLQFLRNYAEERVIPKQMYVPSQSYRVRGRICDVVASASAQLTVFVHLTVCKPTLFSRRDDMCVLACEALIREPTCFGDCTRLNDGGSLHRLVPQGWEVVVWKDPGTEVRDNRIGSTLVSESTWK